MHPSITSLTDERAGRTAVSGGKAASLHQLLKAGLPVPPGFVINTEVHEELILRNPKDLFENLSLPVEFVNAAWEEAQVLLADKKTRLIVRSSATVEDAPTTSFAGIFESILNVSSKAEFENALRKIYAALYEERVIQYCRHQRIPHDNIRMAVVVQQMVPSQKSGVVFTINPLTGNDRELNIEAIHGMGEALVQGSVTPDALRYNWMEGKLITDRTGQQEQWLPPGENQLQPLQHKEKVLTEAEVVKLAGLCVKVQAHYGRPQDIEWAWADGQFYLVQSRPITSYGFEDSEAWTNADFKDGGISSSAATPLMLSFYHHILETSMPEYLRSVNLYPTYQPPAWGKVRFSILYWNMKAVKNGVMKIPGFTERQFDEDLGIEPDYEGPGKKTGFSLNSIINGIKILLATNRSIKQRPEVNRQLLKRIKPVLEEFHQRDVEKLSDAELQEYTQQIFTGHYVAMETGYFMTIYDNSNCKTLFGEKLETYNAKRSDKLDYLKLVPGIKDISHLRPLRALWEIRGKMKQKPELAGRFQKLQPGELGRKHLNGEDYPFKSEVAAFLENYGYHSEHELDICKPHWDENPEPIFHHLQSIFPQPDTQHPDIRWQQQYRQFQNEFEKIRSASLGKKLQQHREMLWWREEMRDCSTRMYHVLRKLSLELGKRFVQQGKLGEADDIFFLPYPEILKLFNTTDTSYRESIRKNRLYYQGFRNFPVPNEIIPAAGISTIGTQETGDLKGIACSSGVVQGTITVVTDVAELHQVKADDILVTRFTDPAWTPVFSRLKGLITETGGMLSHGAIVSREYGIPAILGVKNCTQNLKSGMQIEMNGHTGNIKILEDE